ncbi:phosphoadenylyl-sulfate reductase [Acetobacter thailandicus]|uniref:phosphoadenylyl-sulfate reductase n=1 Tax=Acetobacter thailandicus TaxID=1502842 RepID=UPI001BA8DF04|nr:phosphoadenylyl-sulfate reductase [Acetobacter thailandicus]MBS0985239.1 phosphoadenylyl-sulfate reductase [Acetobacter thailandicus]
MTVTASVLQELKKSEDDPVNLLRRASELLPGKIAVMSSFGAESALLLAFVAEADPALPVIFLQTGQHFPETLRYRKELAERLGLTNVQDAAPPPARIAEFDPTGELWAFDPDACCRIRKVEPLDTACLPYPVLVTGRKRGQAITRQALSVIEVKDDGQVRLNPLAAWSADEIRQEMVRRDLPPHPLVAEGYPSIGCAPCTHSVKEGQDARSGRWAGLAKTECGIHTAR